MLEAISAATESLLRTAAAFSDEDVREPSLLPGWTRGHVLTHIARNADGGTRLLTWARTGVETPEYPSMAARAAEIEAGHARPAAELADDVRDSAARFATAYHAVPPEAWTRPLRWTSGKQRPASRAADSRLTEVLIHHVDLRAGFHPADWPPDFVHRMLADVIAAFRARPGPHLIALDTGAVQGSETDLLAWLLGRSPGTGLTGDLPPVPFLY
ncbi:maleylpyruvate isomerase family mycothiol-dependent enzyme [Winogradskya humida]|uniref:Maleylpyruvate isomerase n=1 Tax=Winogradskya humida TaxID=113566 RepID=A0ABQ3ZZ36_9ACTN|nr:maleylpyruvate isomerase family mycothiol-dependent enzyme [Actinoplanes humidus]GIE23407.1 maleylpyruvate isomerase [Actinoplanes humidus]